MWRSSSAVGIVLVFALSACGSAGSKGGGGGPGVDGGNVHPGMDGGNVHPGMDGGTGSSDKGRITLKLRKA